MLVEYFNGKARNTINVTMVEELLPKDGIFIKSAARVKLHYERASFMSEITEGDGRGFLTVNISYDNFMELAEAAARDPKNPLNIIRIQGWNYSLT